MTPETRTRQQSQQQVDDRPGQVLSNLMGPSARHRRGGIEMHVIGAESEDT